MWIFDRQPATHPWGKALTELQASADVTHQAVGQNWQMDHRVSAEREDVLHSSGSWSGAGSGERWLKGVGRYFKRHLCQPWKDHPTAHSCNARNLTGGPRVPGYDRLIHVASLNRLLSRLARRADADFEERFKDLSGMSYPELRAFLPGPCEVVDDLVRDNLRPRGPDSTRAFTGYLIERAGETQPPWWAGFEDEVDEALTRQDGTGLCQLLGLGDLKKDEWLIAWVYETKNVGPLYRPTVVEAAKTPFHFPSPPAHPWGITMPLREDLPACREVVHPVLGGDLARTACTGRLYRVSEDPGGYNVLKENRRRQQERLRRQFPHTEAQEWLARHFGDEIKP